MNLTLDLDFAEFGMKTFNFHLEIDETLNDGNCPYYSVNSDCSDRISFPMAFAPERFQMDGVSYTLSLVGFSYGDDRSVLGDFISQEYTTSEAVLFAKITAAYPQEETRVPEPQVLGGLLAVGLMLTNRFVKRDFSK